MKGLSKDRYDETFACEDEEICTLLFQFFGEVFASKGYPFKNIFDFTTAGD